MPVTLTAVKIGNVYPWVARIVDTDTQYGFRRDFINGARTLGKQKYYGHTGQKMPRELIITWVLEDGIYEVNDNQKRHFIRVTGDKSTEIERAEVIKELQGAKTVKGEDNHGG